MKMTIPFKINKKIKWNKPDVRTKNRMRRQPVENLSITLLKLDQKVHILEVLIHGLIQKVESYTEKITRK